MRMKQKHTGFLVALVVFSGSAGMASRASGEAESSGRRLGFGNTDLQPVKAEIITKHASIQPGGQTRIGISFDIEKGWHIYAKEPGDAGLPTEINWSAPEAATFAPIQWPKPQEFLDPGDIRTFGYSGSLVLMSDLVVSEKVSEGTILPLKAEVEWLACKDICLPGQASLLISLPVSGAAPSLSTHALLFEQVSE